jgi:hypothetical protein
LFSIQFIQRQHGLRFKKTEYFTISTSVDPSSSFKEKGIDIVGKIEYSGFVYVKAGFESFSVLQGGYKDLHWAMGLNLTTALLKRSRFYEGIRVPGYGEVRIEHIASITDSSRVLIIHYLIFFSGFTRHYR